MAMKKRIAVALLWFYATWYAWMVLAEFAGLTDLVGPVLGAAAAALMAGDPMHRIWTRVGERAESVNATSPGDRQVA
jgi:hypothetical protein